MALARAGRRARRRWAQHPSSLASSNWPCWGALVHRGEARNIRSREPSAPQGDNLDDENPPRDPPESEHGVLRHGINTLERPRSRPEGPARAQDTVTASAGGRALHSTGNPAARRTIDTSAPRRGHPLHEIAIPLDALLHIDLLEEEPGHLTEART